MDLRDYLTGETTGFVDRLIEASEAAVRKARADAEGVIDAFRAQVDAERARADVLTRQMEAEKSRADALGAQLDADRTAAASATLDLETERDRTASLAAALDAAHERLASIDARISALTTELEDQRRRAASLASQLEAERTASASRKSDFEAQSARMTALASDLEAAQQRFTAADEARRKAESTVAAATNELQGMRELLESARAEAIRAGDAFQSEAAQNALLQQAHESEVLQLQSQRDEAAAEVKRLEQSLASAEARAAEAAAAARIELQSLREQLAAHAESRQNIDARLASAEAAVTAMRTELDDANALTDATSAELSATTKRFTHLIAMLKESAAALERLGGARATADVFTALVRELSAEFDRVAIFRLKSNHLEGEHAAGLDDAVDVQKIVVPIGLESVITKAVSSRVLEHAAKEQIGEGRPPFGGSPASALAAPLLFENEVLAIVYAESDAPVSEAHGPLAAALVRHANAVLAGLAVELRTSRQLREYARTLLHEAERMFDADVQSQVPEAVRGERLRESVRFAHDLYSQRAALDGAPAMNLLDDEIGRLLREPSTPFIAALESVVAEQRDVQASATA